MGAKKRVSTKTGDAKPGVAKARRALRIPQNLDQATTLLGELGALQHRAQALADATDAAVARIREKADANLAALHQKIADRFEKLRAFSTARRNELTEDGKTKTIKLATGKMFWRDTPSRIEIEDEKKVLAFMEGYMEFEKFIRRPDPEIDRAEMRKDEDLAETIPGVKVESGEEFRVKPESGTGELNASMVEKLLKKAV